MVKYEYKFFNIPELCREKRAERGEHLTDIAVSEMVMNELGSEGWQLDLNTLDNRGTCYGVREKRAKRR